MLLRENMGMLLGRGVARGWRTFRRERGWGIALGSLFGVFILMQVLLVLLISMEGMQMLLQSRADVRLEVRNTASATEINNFIAALRALPYVANVVYVTKEQAYARAQAEDPQLIAFLDEFGLDNPFPDTIGVTLANLDDYNRFATFIEEDDWRATIDPAFLSEATDQEKYLFELMDIARAGRATMLLILILTLAVLLLITTEVVRRRALMRSDEVMVENIAGAHPVGILLPFATEALLLLALGILASIAAILLLLYTLPYLIPAFAQTGALGPLRDHIEPILYASLPLYFAIEAGVAPVVAFCGAWMGIRPQLHHHTLAGA